MRSSSPLRYRRPSQAPRPRTVWQEYLRRVGKCILGSLGRLPLGVWVILLLATGCLVILLGLSLELQPADTFHVQSVPTSGNSLVISSESDLRRFWHSSDFQCVGWRGTGHCQRYQPRNPQEDGSCDAIIQKKRSGFCEFKNSTTNQSIVVLGQTCEDGIGPFRCRDLLSFLPTTPYKAIDSLRVLRELSRSSRGLKCVGYRGVGEESHGRRRIPTLDASCDEYIVGTGYCEYKDARDVLHKFSATEAFGIDAVFTCNSLLQVEGDRPASPSSTFALSSAKEFENVKETPGFFCLGLRALDRQAQTRLPERDITCNVTFELPSHGWCEYYNADLSILYRLYLNSTSTRGSASCQDPLKWYWNKFRIVYDHEEAIKLFDSGKELKCRGLRRTLDCNPLSQRSYLDANCSDPVFSQSGYCEFYTEDTQESFGFAPHGCKSFRHFECNFVPDMMKFSLAVRRFAAAVGFHDPRTINEGELLKTAKRSRGIVVCVHEDIWLNAYSLFRLLMSYNCQLPIEVWSMDDELTRNPTVTNLLASAYHSVTFRVVDSKSYQLKGFLIKPYAVVHSSFDQLLLLDADSFPVRDPEYLFESLEYRNYGAIFWPDYWNVENFMFADVDAQSLLWKMLDVEYTETYEQESGQLVVDRRRCTKALKYLEFFVKNSHVFPYFTWGDKDMFRLAWMKSRTKFYMLDYPGTAGTIVEGKFCGNTMVQFDPMSEVLFMHRNMAKLGSSAGRHLSWEYYTEYRGGGYLSVKEWKMFCYYMHDHTKSVSVRDNESLRDFEKVLLGFAGEGIRRFRSHCLFSCDTKGYVTTKELASLGRDDRSGFEPFHSAADSETEDMGKTQALGYDRMRGLTAVFGVIVINTPNAAFSYEYNIARLERTGRRFKSYEVVVIEELSAGLESDVITAWAKRNPRVSVFKFAPDSAPDLSNCKAAALRNQLLSQVLQHNAEYVIFLDVDEVGGWDVNGIANSFGLLAPLEVNFVPRVGDASLQRFYSPWQVSCSNVQMPSLDKRYGDARAFRGIGFGDTNYRDLEKMQISPDKSSFEVDSCYGRLIIYDKSIIGNCSYAFPDAVERMSEGGLGIQESQHKDSLSHGLEIVQFHKCLKAKGVRFQLNPRQVAYWSQSPESDNGS